MLIKLQNNRFFVYEQRSGVNDVTKLTQFPNGRELRQKQSRVSQHSIDINLAG